MPKQYELFAEKAKPGDEIESKVAARRGPPNRMNDLSYREWMKFQKSFFRYVNDQELVKQSIEFFTKAVWGNDKASRSLILCLPDFDACSIKAPRVVHTQNISSLEQLSDFFRHEVSSQAPYDFVLVDLRALLATSDDLDAFLSGYADMVFRSLRQVLAPERYCVLLVNVNDSSDPGFPIPWSVGLAARHELRLRDEKIGLMPDNDYVLYYLVMQAQDDERSAVTLNAGAISATRPNTDIPTWTIPKPPPRKKNEILHPAKFPETLIQEFIEIFTAPGELVFDPMAGTGSTIIAALRSNRDGYGVDLNADFVEIANNRVANEPLSGGLFAGHTGAVAGRIFQGDSTQLEMLPELGSLRFHYAVTSPPYWSMLQNPGSENQEVRRRKQLKLVYSDNPDDLGNVSDYDEFMDLLDRVYRQVAKRLVEDGCLTVVVKNIKRNHVVYPLAWDLVSRLAGPSGGYDYLGTTFWCQDDVGLKPFAVGIHWVSNTLHQYCLHFRKRRENDPVV